MSSQEGSVFPRLVEELQNKVLLMEARDGKKPTFENYIYEMIDEKVILYDDLEISLRAHSLIWSGARLGTTNSQILLRKIEDDFFMVSKNMCHKDSDKPFIQKRLEKSRLFNNSGFLTVVKFVKKSFRFIDKESVRIIRELGILRISILVMALYYTRDLLRILLPYISYKSVEDEIEGGKYLLFLFFLVFILFPNNNKKNEYLVFMRSFLIPRIFIYLLIVCIVLFFVNLM